MQHAGRWKGKESRRWIIQHAGRCTEAGQEKDRAACPQMYTGRQEMDHAACQQMDRGTTCRQMDRDRELVQAVGGQIDN